MFSRKRGPFLAPLKRGNDPFTPSGSRFDCILLERYVNTLTSGDFPFVQLGRDLHPSFLQLGFLHMLEVFFFTLTRDHVFPETYPRQSNLFQSVKEQKPCFAELDQILALPCRNLTMAVLNFVTELAVAPRLTWLPPGGRAPIPLTWLSRTMLPIRALFA